MSFFRKIKKNIDRVAIVTRRVQSEPAFTVYITRNTSC